MGLDIIAISKARAIICPGGEACPEHHFRVSSSLEHRDPVKPGCYVAGRGGRRFSYRVGSYLAYNIWRRHLSLLALGEEPEAVWDHPRRFCGKPFVELIDHPDGGGFTIGPKTACKLFQDFLTYAPKAGEYYSQRQRGLAQPPRSWFKRELAGRQCFNQCSMLIELRVAKGLGGKIITGPLDDLRWMRAAYLNFCSAFYLAGNAGFVVLS